MSIVAPPVSAMEAVEDSEERTGAREPQAECSLPAVVLPAGGVHLRRPVHRPDPLVLLLQPHPVDALRHRVHRLGQLRPVLPGAVLLQGFMNTFIFGFVTSGSKSCSACSSPCC